MKSIPLIPSLVRPARGLAFGVGLSLLLAVPNVVGAHPSVFAAGSHDPKDCLACHGDTDRTGNKAVEVMGTVHWSWVHTNAPSSGPVQILGKRNVVNNFCIATESNEARCTVCHVGLGWRDHSFDFSDPSKVDCLVCHDTTGTYKKTFGGVPDPKVDLDYVARNVGKTSRATCGACHFYGGGGNAVKHGDLDSTLANPSRELDVHMGVDGGQRTCAFCHYTERHQFRGSVYSEAAPSNALCEDCHTREPHQDPVIGERLNRHTHRVACQTCHIPFFARGGQATKMTWDWSAAGDRNPDGSDKVIMDAEGNPIYHSKKGSFTWQSNVQPEYVWFNGDVRFVTLDDPITPGQTLRINALQGDVHDPRSRIVPVKRFTGVQPYDAASKTLVVPHLFPFDPTDTSAYWKGYNWTNAIAAGMDYIGRPFSGQVGWVQTEMVWIQNHMVAPKEQALTCTECHTARGRLDFLALGYPRERALTLQNMMGFVTHVERSEEPAGVVLKWMGIPGYRYQVQTATDLADRANWRDAPDGERVVSGDTPEELTWTDPAATGAAKYYRVVRDGSSRLETAVERLRSMYSPEELEANVYVGSEVCLSCHGETDYLAFRQTKHAETIRRPTVEHSLEVGRGVIADYDRNGVDDFIQGLDFNQITSGFDPYKPNAPRLSVRDGQYFMTIGTVDFPIVFANGGTGEWRERYGVRIPASDSPTGYSDDIYFAPLQYNDTPHQWLPYKPQLWWMPDGQPKIHDGMTRSLIATTAKGTFSKNCIGCHMTGIRGLGKTPQGEWHFEPYPAVLFNDDDPAYVDYDNDGRKDLLNVGCEMCHGPGATHVLRSGDPAAIVNPANLTASRANEVCGRCHNRQRSVPSRMFNWPYDETSHVEWRPGQAPLEDYTIAAGEYWPDEETSFEHNQHFAELNESAHVAGQDHPMRCFDCHDPHQRGNHNQIRTHLVVNGLSFEVRSEDNTLCLACHAGAPPFAGITPAMVADYGHNVSAIGAEVSAHTHHGYAPDGILGLSRCVSCHMPSTANTQRESVHKSHTFRVVPPEKTLAYFNEGGMPNACAVSCHSQKVDIWGLGTDSNMHAWDEPFDVDLATHLLEYYGPQAIWWQKVLHEE